MSLELVLYLKVGGKLAIYKNNIEYSPIDDGCVNPPFSGTLEDFDKSHPDIMQDLIRQGIVTKTE